MQPTACTMRKVKEDMTVNKGEKQDETGPRKQQNGLPPEIIDIMLPALQVGAITGISGLFVGSFAGVVRSSTPKLFALASGIQWFTLGTTFAASRGAILHEWEKGIVTPRDKVSASAIAGGISGMVGGLLRGPRNVIPGAIMFSLFGAGGQGLYNKADARRTQASDVSEEQKHSWLNSKWSPVKVLTDVEYENMLREKLLKVNAQIALVDERIESIRQEGSKERTTDIVEAPKTK